MTQKVEKAIVKLGEYEIEAYLHKDGSYSFGYEFLAEIAEKDKSILSNKKSPYHLKRLIHSQKFSRSVKIKGIGYTYKSVTMK